jgi:hypothetical protein
MVRWFFFAALARCARVVVIEKLTWLHASRVTTEPRGAMDTQQDTVAADQLVTFYTVIRGLGVRFSTCDANGIVRHAT